MFLDISFIGAASYRKDGYARIYKSLRKHRRRSICVEDSSAQQLMDARELGVNVGLQCDRLDVSLRYLSNERKIESCARKYNDSHLYDKHEHSGDIRLYNKHYSRKDSPIWLNRVSIAGYHIWGSLVQTGHT